VGSQEISYHFSQAGRIRMRPDRDPQHCPELIISDPDPAIMIKISVADPDTFQSGSGTRLKSQSGSGSR
jgi:hypothetical protein